MAAHLQAAKPPATVGYGDRVAELDGLALRAALDLDPDQLIADIDHASEMDLAAHPRVLLLLAWVLEPLLRMTERHAALERAARLSEDEGLNRSLDTERALDMCKSNRLDAAEELANKVLAGADDSLEAVTIARAREAQARVLAWRGTASASEQAGAILAEVAARYAELDAPQWQGTVLFWRANAVHFQRGHLDEAEQGMRLALQFVGPARQAMIHTFLADLLAYRGRSSAAAECLTSATALAAGDKITLAYVSWSRTNLASYTGDVALTVRLAEETDRDLAGLSLTNTRTTFLADAAQALDRVGEVGLAAAYLARAQAQDPNDEFVRLAGASQLARHGDPVQALVALRQVLREPWLEARLIWRVSLLSAWALMRSERHAEAGQLAGRALEQVAGLGGVEVARTTEPTLLAGLLPLAAVAGSDLAISLLHPTGRLARLLGDASVRQAPGGTPVELPPGQQGQLARLVLTSPDGCSVDRVLELMWPEDPPDVGRRRLRQVLSRLREKWPGLIERRGERLMAHAWVDLVAFQQRGRAAMAAADADAAGAALALWGGHPLPTDLYAEWAVELAESLVALRVRLLELCASAAQARRDLTEAARLLELAITEDRYDEGRYERTARLHLAAGSTPAARRLLSQAAAALAEIGVAAPAWLTELTRLV